MLGVVTCVQYHFCELLVSFIREGSYGGRGGFFFFPLLRDFWQKGESPCYAGRVNFHIKGTHDRREVDCTALRVSVSWR